MAITHLTIMAILAIMAIMAIMACHIMAVNMAKCSVTLALTVMEEKPSTFQHVTYHAAEGL